MKKFVRFIKEHIDDPFGEEIWEEESMFMQYIRMFETPLEKITYVDLENRNLENLDGIKKLKNLEILFCDHNKLENIDEVQFCEKIEYLDIDNNKITNIDFIENLKELKELRFSYNKLENIDIIKKLKKLEMITFDHNNFSKEYENELKEYLIKNNIVYWDIDLKKWYPHSRTTS